MQPHQHVITAGFAENQRHVLGTRHLVAVAGGPELAVPGWWPGLGDPGDRVLGPATVGDEVRDRDDHQAVLVGEFAQLGQPGNGAVVAHDLHDAARRLQPGEAGQVDRSLGVTRPLEHAELTRPKREDVTRSG